MPVVSGIRIVPEETHGGFKYKAVLRSTFQPVCDDEGNAKRRIGVSLWYHLEIKVRCVVGRSVSTKCV